MEGISLINLGKQDGNRNTYIVSVPEGYELKPTYETKSERVQLVWTPSLKNRVKKKALQSGLSVNEYVHRVLAAVTSDL